MGTCVIGLPHDVAVVSDTKACSVLNYVLTEFLDTPHVCRLLSLVY